MKTYTSYTIRKDESGDLSEDEIWQAYLQIARRQDEEHSKRVDRIASLFAGRSLGRFVLQNLVAAHVAKRFPAATLHAMYRSDAPFKEFIVACNPYVEHVTKVGPHPSRVLALDWFDVGVQAPGRHPDPRWYEADRHLPDLFLVPSMLSVPPARMRALVEAPPGFRIAAERVEPLTAALAAKGLDPDRWFACLHLRTGRHGDARDVALDAYVALVRHIVERQDGRVIRLAAFAEAPFPAIDGLIDCARTLIPLEAQAMAASRARYFIGTDAGPLALASAFRTPAAATNMVGYGTRVWNTGDVVLAKERVRADGRTLRTREAFEHGLLEDDGGSDVFGYRDNTPEDLIAVADHLCEQTADCSGWRPPREDVPPRRTGRIRLPLEAADDPALVFWD